MNRLFIGGPLDGQIHFVSTELDADAVYAPVQQSGDDPFYATPEDLVWEYRPYSYAWNKPRGPGLPDEGPRMLPLMVAGNGQSITTDQVMTALAKLTGLLVLDHRDTWNNSAGLDVEICGAR